MKRIMLNLFVSWLMIVALIAPFRVDAQTPPSLTIQSGFSQFCHNHPTQCPGGSRVVGRNNFISIYPLSVPFTTAGSGACAYDPVTEKYTTTCQGVTVRATTPNTIRLMQLTFVSPFQINAIADYQGPLGETVSSFQVVVRNGITVTHQQTFNFDERLVLPAGDYNIDGTFCQRGDAYNVVTGQYIQYVGNCSAFPRTASGQPTIVQIYFGGKFLSAQTFDVWVNGTQVLDDQPGFRIQNDGWNVINVSPPAGGWLSGNNIIKIMDSTQSSSGSIYSETAVVVGQP